MLITFMRYLVGGIVVEPQLYFRRQLVWEMVENTLYEETEAGGGLEDG